VVLQINHDDKSESEDFGISAGPFGCLIEFTFYSLESSYFNDPFISSASSLIPELNTTIPVQNVIFSTIMESRPPSKLVVNYISASNPKPPLWNTINIMKTTNSLRRQYSVETIDPGLLSLLASQLERRLILDGGEKRTDVYSGDSLGQLCW
jgi:hypothetical protein